MRFVLGLSVIALLGCPKPNPNPQPDSVVTDSVVSEPDTIGPDSGDTADVGDSIVTLKASDTLPAPRGLRRLGPPTLGFGMFNTPKSQWGKYNFNGIVAGVLPRYLGGQLRSWDSYGMAGIANFPHNLLVNSNGTWSLTKCMALADAYVQYFPRDSIVKYVNKGVLKGFNTGDDFTSKSQWGGKIISQADQAKCMAHARDKFGSQVPLGVRVTMPWILKYSGWGTAKPDFAWAQYRTSKGSLSSYLGDNAKLARDHGMKIILGLNSHNCHSGTDSGPCKPSEVRAFLKPMIEQYTDVNCFVPSWRWDDNDWRNSDFRAAFTEMGLLAKSQSARSCLKA